MLFLKIALQILAVTIAILVNRLDYVTHDKRTKKFKTGRRFLFVLSVCFLIASIIVTINDESAKNKELKEVTDRLNSHNSQLQKAQQLITGGNNFCYINLVPGGHSVDQPLLVAINDGNQPLYDVTFRMWDPADYGPNVEPMRTLDDFNKNAYNVNVGNLSPHAAKTIGQIELPDSDAKNYEITIIARNGTFIERMKLRRVNGAWKRAFRVHSGYNRDESTILIEKIDPDFPRDGGGAIQWE
jgi:hypothetical protein